MKKEAIFMNIGRGKSVVEAHLVEALQNKTIKGAVLDVFETEPSA
jgi:phosphoglycerate dehydrogenase-like enzyme